jgi:SagB-type dehydrogenase family enzyme
MRTARGLIATACAAALLLAGGCAERPAAAPAAPAPPTPAGDAPPWDHDSVRFLGPGDELGEAELLDAMSRRGSVRELSAEPISDRQLAALLWSAQGVSTPSGMRTAPSAGALFPLETYVVTPAEVLRYVPATASVEVREDPQAKERITAAIAGATVSQAYAVVVITGVPARITGKYAERGIRYMWMEAGHAAQNLLLAAAAMDLGAVPIGAFDDAGVGAALGLSNAEIPLYLIPVGRLQG